MLATLTITRYSKMFSWAGIMSMALFRLPLATSKNISFYKLLGCGKNGTFSKVPDLRQWCILTVFNEAESETISKLLLQPAPDLNLLHHKIYGDSITRWWNTFNCETCTIVLQPIEGHGLWDGKAAFGPLPGPLEYDGIIGVLTRATINLKKIRRFWQHVNGVTNSMNAAPGFIMSVGIGEAPWIRQATFSVWQSKMLMKDFAYKMQEHAAVVKKTRSEGWYKEEMFIRFAVLASLGTLNGKNPLHEKQ